MDNTNHLLGYIDIKDFKCFKDFHAEGFKRVNLIGGKNNVGKTAFMEACYISVMSKNIKAFVWVLNSIKYMRENLNILTNHQSFNMSKFIEKSDGLYIQSNINKSLFKVEDKEGIKNYIFEFNEEYVKVNVKDFSFENIRIKNIDFIDSFGFANTEIVSSYSSIQKKDKEDFLNKKLNQFDERIESFKVIDDLPQCKVNGEWLEVTELGDGVRHLVSIIVSLFNSENGYLFIDEIDNGIHYTQLDDLWDVILEVSQDLNVQVFATTHSKEMIESFARISKKLEDKDISYIKMSRLKDGSINAGVRDYEMIQYNIDDDHEVR
jgi:AAA15 family ATPase/GTPase